MKRLYLLCIICSASLVALAQSTFESVYSIIQAQCGSCHVPGHESGLVLSGSEAEVYDALYNATPANDAAEAHGYKLVAPGDPYRSFLF